MSDAVVGALPTGSWVAAFVFDVCKLAAAGARVGHATHNLARMIVSRLVIIGPLVLPFMLSQSDACCRFDVSICSHDEEYVSLLDHSHGPFAPCKANSVKICELLVENRSVCGWNEQRAVILYKPRISLTGRSMLDRRSSIFCPSSLHFCRIQYKIHSRMSHYQINSHDSRP